VLLGEGNREQARDYYERSLAAPGGTPDPELDRELGSTRRDERQADEPKRAKLTPRGETVDDSAADDPSAAILEVERPKTKFDDVGGMEAVKQEFRMKVLHPMRNPDLFRAYGKKIGGGVLLYGPPGCGKTLLSTACAGEMDCTFMAIGIHQVLDMFLGNSEKLLHETFALARRHVPCILFFDEVDALAADRVHLRYSAGRTLINQFLAEMDGG